MARRIRIPEFGIVAILSVLVAIACDRNDSTAPPASPQVLTISYREEVTIDTVFDEDAKVDSLWRDGQTLHAIVSEPRSCAVGYAAIASRRFTASNPPTFDLYLRCVSEGNCGLVTTAQSDTLVIDLRTAFQRHGASYPDAAPWRIRFLSRSGRALLAQYTGVFFDIPATPAPATLPSDLLEADAAALWLSGEDTAPEQLRSQVAHDLATIRSTFRDSIDRIDRFRFVPPADDHGVGLFPDEATARAILVDNYRAWDQANRALQLSSFELSGDNWLTLHFEQRRHPGAFASLYGALPGMRCAFALRASGSEHYLLPRRRGERISYLFQDGPEYCPVGCGYYYFYFVPSTGSTFDLVGAASGGAPRQPWWPEAVQSFALYQSWFGCCQVGACAGGAPPGTMR